MKIARVLELLVGVVFLVAAAAKTYDMYGFAQQVGEYGIFPTDPDTKLALAWIMTTVEAVIGAALIAGLHLHGMLLATTAALLVVFSGLIAYGWAYHDLEDCGCFGATIKLGPGWSIAKNVVLLGMTGYAWFELRKAPPDVDRKLRSPALAAAGAALAAVFAVGLLEGGSTVDDGSAIEGEVDEVVLAERPFAKFAFRKDDGTERKLGEGSYVVAVLNADCPHCRDSVAPLNELAQMPDQPLVIGLVMAYDTEAMDEFTAFTQPLFETYTIDAPTMFELMGEGASAPPVFHAVVDGAQTGFLAVEELTLEELLKLAESAQPTE